MKNNIMKNKKKIKGNQYNGSAKIEGDIIIQNMKTGHKGVTKAIREFSKLYKNENEHHKATLTKFIKWLFSSNNKHAQELVALFVAEEV